ncbi:acetylxylan esterase [Nocardia suismassiliense]|uniref:Acetylxylan esterase n=1 Tax=Nocardia suismassiliense TaxID=2077092 RepID=A0ABW6R7R0_9NOCA
MSMSSRSARPGPRRSFPASPPLLSSVLALVLSAAAMLSSAAPTAAQPATSPQPSAPVPSASGDFGSEGPYATAVRVGAIHTLYYPRDIGASSRRHPVIIWGNGTFAAPLHYRTLLLHWASHGFIVSAANTGQSGSAYAMLAGIDALARADADSGSEFYQHVDLAHVAAAGHSQGGAGAIVAGADERIDTVLPIAPGPLADIRDVHGPAFLMAGQTDLIVRPWLVQSFYNAATQIPAIYGELRGVGHFTIGLDPPVYFAATTAWLRFQLMGEPEARAMFYGPACGICTDTDTWSEVRRNALVPQ